MTGDGLAQHLAAAGVEGGVQGQSAVTVVFKAVTFQPSGRERQHRIEPVQGLNGRLLIDAEHRGVAAPG
jgi:hypothetical protein